MGSRLNIIRGIREFLNSIEEWHAFWVGAGEVMCPWRCRIAVSVAQLGYIQKEFHYYMIGRAFGFILLLGMLVGVGKAVQVIFW